MPVSHQRGGERLGPGDRPLLALAELLGRGDPQGDGLGGDHVLERAALLAGEDRRVDLLGVLLAADDHPRAGTADRLVGRRRDDVGVGHGVRVDAGGDEAGEVGHVDHEEGADVVGDRPEALEVLDPRVGRPAGEEELRPALEGDPLDLVHVDQVGLGGDLVGAMSYSRPETLPFMPWVRWPPWGSARPMIVSPGRSSAW